MVFLLIPPFLAVTPPAKSTDPFTELTARDEQGKIQRFQIRGVELDPEDPEGEVELYTVYFFNESSQTWENLCEGG